MVLSGFVQNGKSDLSDNSSRMVGDQGISMESGSSYYFLFLYPKVGLYQASHFAFWNWSHYSAHYL